MNNGHALTTFERRSARDVLTESNPRWIAPRYRHVLVPTSLDDADRPALMRGIETAVLHRATLSVLHVLPYDDRDVSVHWLDAIDRLYRSLDRPKWVATPGGDDAAADTARRRIKTFVDRMIPRQQFEEVEIRAECRTGDVAEGIAKYAADSAADVVFMSIGPPRWWLPTLPAAVRRVLQLARREVVLVRPALRS